MDGEQLIGSVLLGEHFVRQIYEAIKNSDSEEGSNRQNTLLIITFDEHGGCYDHVPPPTDVVPPEPDGYKTWMDFKYNRLGVRVPMIMVSPHIAKNTVVNEQMDHTRIKTMQAKWERIAPGKFPSLSARVTASPRFDQVFTSLEKAHRNDRPEISEPIIPPNINEIDVSNVPLNDLQGSIAAAAVMLREGRNPLEVFQKYAEQASHDNITVGGAKNTLAEVRGLVGHGGINL